MKNRVSQLALRIALIEEEFSQSEIDEAVRLVEQHRPTDALLRYLGGHGRAPRADKVRETSSNRSYGSHSSVVVLALEQKDPDKFQVLSHMDAMIRKGEWLPQLDDIKKLAAQLSKDFVPKRSRRESINPLLALLADRPIDEIRRIANEASSRAASNDELAYTNLARFIVTGKPSSDQVHTH